jgi:hypothetical protein
VLSKWLSGELAPPMKAYMTTLELVARSARLQALANSEL